MLCFYAALRQVNAVRQASYAPPLGMIVSCLTQMRCNRGRVH